MAYVRAHGNQLAIVHGERDSETGDVRQRVLFTLCSKAEASAAIDKPPGGFDLARMLQQRYPRIRIDWDRIRSGIEERMDVLPEIYPYRAGEVLGRFREELCTFVRTLGLADPQTMHTAAELIREHKTELLYLRELIDWRLKLCEQEANEWNGDNAFFWRHRLRPRDVPVEVMDRMSTLYDERKLDDVEALARLFIDTYEDYADGHNYLGLVALDRGQFEEAIVHFERTMEVGRKLFPKRLAKKHYWDDLDTRPYMRGMRNLAITLLRAERYDDALTMCERLDRECGDTDTATTLRASIALDTGQWEEAKKAAERLVAIWPAHAYIAAFASFELGKLDEARVWFLHGLLNRPRTGHILLSLRTSPPKSYMEVEDHNGGIENRASLAGFLEGQSDASQAFFEGLLEAASVQELLAEVAEVEQRWRQSRGGDRRDYDRLMQMHSLPFAREVARRVAVEKSTRTSRPGR